MRPVSVDCIVISSIGRRLKLRQLWKGQAKDQKSGTLLDCIDKMKIVCSYEEREKRDGLNIPRGLGGGNQ